MRIKASKLPKEILFAFADAIEAWSTAEHELFMLWQLLNRRTDIDAAWAVFSDWNPSRQRQETEKTIADRVADVDARSDLLDIIERMRALADKRNRIVHGRWGVLNVWEGSKHAGLEYIRVYDARGEPARPKDEAEEAQMLGRTRFYSRELRRAEAEFGQIAREIHLGKVRVLRFALRQPG